MLSRKRLLLAAVMFLAGAVFAADSTPLKAVVLAALEISKRE